jgi:hypothetical protein
MGRTGKAKVDNVNCETFGGCSDVKAGVGRDFIGCVDLRNEIAGADTLMHCESELAARNDHTKWGTNFPLKVR